MEKTTPALSQDEIQRFIDLGLGRGVDSTDPYPWANKSSFQVRHLLPGDLSDLIGTDEGGLLRSYVSRIASTKDTQAELKASISIPYTPVSLGIDGELSRSFSTTMKVKHRTVTNRTVSFRMGSLSVPKFDTKMAAENTSEPNQLPPSFEEILSRWIWKWICHRNADRKLEEVIEKSAISLLHEYLQNSSKEEAALIVEDCSDFVSYFGVTHYVSSLALGASESTVVSKSKQSSITQQGADASVPKIASMKQKLSLKSAFSSSVSAKQYIGRIVKKEVKRDSSDEAVIDVKILPIYSLVHHNPFIFLALHKAIVDYAEERTLNRACPYVIECSDEGMYWKVDADHTLTITRNFKQASVFHVIPYDDSHDTNDFSIGWKGETLQSVIDEEDVVGPDKTCKIMRYLDVKPCCCKHHPGPLKFESTLTTKNARLCIYDRLISGYFGGYFESPAPDLEPWTQKKLPFFISSASRKTFITVERSRNAEQAENSSEEEHKFTIKCAGSRKVRDENDSWQLFRLLPAEEDTKTASIMDKARKRLSDKLSNTGHFE